MVFESVFFSMLFVLFAAVAVKRFFHPLDGPVLGQDTPYGVGSLLPTLLRNPGSLAARHLRPGSILAVRHNGDSSLLLIFFNVMCATFIAVRTGIRHKATAVREIVIPLLGTFIMTLLPLSTHVGWLGEPFAFPAVWTVPLLATGTVLGLAGGAFTVYALMYLKRNFSIFVEVRAIVLEGPYRYVRHPMYLGEITMMVGLVLSRLSPFSIGLLGCLVLFQYLRARMEQDRLSEASPENATHMRSSGMFFPRTHA